MRNQQFGRYAVILALAALACPAWVGAKGRPEFGTLVVSCPDPRARIFVDGMELEGPIATTKISSLGPHVVRAGRPLDGDELLAFEARDVRVETDGVECLAISLAPSTRKDSPALAFALGVRHRTTARLAGDVVGPELRLLARGAESNSVELLDRSGRVVRLLGDRGDYWVSHVSALGFSGDGRTIATTGVDFDTFVRTVSVWETGTGRRLAAFHVKGEDVEAVALDTNGRLVAAAFDPATVRLWDIAKRRLVWQSERLSKINSMSRIFFGAGERTLVTDADEYTTTAVLDARTGTIVTKLPGTLYGVLADGRVATFGHVGPERESVLELRVWDSVTGRPIATRRVSQIPNVYCATWPVCVSSGAGRTEVWNWADGTLLWATEGHASGITFDGRLLATERGIFELPPIDAPPLDMSVPGG